MFATRIVFGLLFFVFSFNAFAQNSDDAVKDKLEKETKFLEQILSDAKNLRLPENRAFVFAKVGDALWQLDEKRARQLFQNSINELITAQNEVENEKNNKQLYQNLLYGQSPRWEILWLIANRDADFALDAQIKTRPNRLPQTLESFAQNQNYSNVFQYAKTEINNEQRLISIAADRNPERAAKLLRESLKKSITYEALNLLRKIYAKDAELGAKLADEIGEKFLAADLTKNYDEMGVLSNFLEEFAKEKTADDKGLRISDKLARDLASKLIDTWLNSDVTSLYGNYNAPTFEKLFPERMLKVKQKVENLNNPSQTPQFEAYNKLIQSNVSGEELLRQSENFPQNLRSQIKYQAAYKLAQSGNISEATKTIKEIYPDQVDNYVSQWNADLASQAVSKGKFDEASLIISQIPDENQRVNALIYLASAIYQKDQKENKTLALSVLDQARAIISEQPESYNELNSLMNLANNYATIEPTRAFALIAPLIEPLNELSQATAVIAKYGNNGNFRQGEFQISSGSNAFGVYFLDSVLRTLKSKDSERTMQLSNGFSRLDVRLALQLQLIENNLQIDYLPLGTRFSSLQR